MKTRVQIAPEGTVPSGDGASPSPPIARRRPVRTTVHGVELVDDYAWLAERGSPEALAHLEAENRYSEEMLRPIEALRDRLYEEFVGRIQETDMSVPVPLDDCYYHTRTEEGLQYGIYCRRRGSLEAAEEVLLDLNQRLEGRSSSMPVRSK